MARILVGNSNNILTATFSASAKTLAIANCTAFDLTQADLEYVYNTTRSLAFDLTAVTGFTAAWVSGLRVYTWTFSRVPTASADADVLYVYLQVPTQFTDFLVLEKIATATI